MQKEIITTDIRPSTNDDCKNRIKQINVNLEIVILDYENANYKLQYASNEEYEKLCSLYHDGVIKMRFDTFYDCNGNVINTIQDVTKNQYPKYDKDAKEAVGEFKIDGYIEINELFIGIRGIGYKIPIVRITETFSVNKDGKPVVLIKSEALGIDKLITDEELREMIKSLDKKSLSSEETLENIYLID